ncbi:D-2-hydroxyacid dehydrogenase [Treponema succinifaciens]|uniref:D-2-hydroxyacid dehydrogenase n=1 Tax=Treponema succinifaciens TaxID=167 RepID=UPI0023F3182B|nr:D-2-hydroxyacid dehydrogenase [Treponema succinifaciens]
MKITVLDGNALNPGDLSWSPLEKFGQVAVFPRTEASLVAERIGDSDAILLNKINITEEILDKCPKLKYIGVQATGYNVIDLEACKRHNITVTNVPSYSTAGVAQLVFAFISEFTCHTQLHSDSVMSGEWTNCPDFCYWKVPLIELEGKTLGIFGYGSIGSRVARIAEAYGMKVIVCTRTPKPEIKNPVDISTLFNESDFISLHAPLTEKTRNVVNKTTLSLMKKTAFLINTARGPLVNEKDVREFLDNGRIAGYAADVVSEEPMKKDNPLLGAKNCIITPHIAWAATETRQRLLNIVIENLKCFIMGKPQNVVS